MLVDSLALIGIPFLTVFYSKDVGLEILNIFRNKNLNLNFHFLSILIL